MAILGNGVDGALGGDLDNSTSHLQEKLAQYKRLEGQVWKVRIILLAALVMVIAAGGVLGAHAYGSWSMKQIQASLNRVPDEVFREVDAEPYLMELAEVYRDNAVRGLAKAWPEIRQEGEERIDELKVDGNMALAEQMDGAFADDLLKKVAAGVAEKRGLDPTSFEELITKQSPRLKLIIQRAVMGAAESKIEQGAASYHSFVGIFEGQEIDAEDKDVVARAKERFEASLKYLVEYKGERSTETAEVDDAK